ncbi:MAG: alpha-mannosyltransferase [Sneathiella sp.]|jgi:glycosyltransferase involved in cell wall biosynthesis|uniref:glycosyltransferase family 4 protein n=1 Tax=Sneathiella sp. TaxID=1964365 RepID=UPI000C592750|nr:glycosyltransferase family 1 protein [Sneathiella sp.]MAL77708.1 alpha-mannosyltransferase [Sneathiella sp.]
MRILIVTDAWHPQINGVVRTLSQLAEILTATGDDVTLVTPESFLSLPCPTYPEIRLSLFPGKRLAEAIARCAPEAIHIATEGPLGLAARRYCRRHRLPFTTAFHTRFPEYLNARLKLPVDWGYHFLRWFHRPSAAVMVATQSLENELKGRGLRNIRRWTRGIDTATFHPRTQRPFRFPSPVFLYVGRVAVEKNIEDFLKLDLPGSKVIVGDGPQRRELENRYPTAFFLGVKEGEKLAELYSSADVFVFPSLTDTFGLVLLEALASGVPVAAYPVTGPLDVIGDAPVGVLDNDLAAAAMAALSLDRAQCRAHAMNYSWQASAAQFRQNLVFFRSARTAPVTAPDAKPALPS